MDIQIKTLNSVRLTKLFIASSRWLSKYADILNDLNVYPVPDGDTGTNMSMTLQAVENELVKLDYEPNMKELCDLISDSILFGARGNSGTILSQIVQGFLSVLENYEEFDIPITARALIAAKDKAYQAVSEPIEGTILTVIRKVAEAAIEYEGKEDDFVPFLIYLKQVAEKAVEETPNELEKLKEAGVVDAGGKGIFYILEGFEKSISDPEMLKDLDRIVKAKIDKREKLDFEEEDIQFKYCTEFIIENSNFPLEEYKEKILPFGDSLVCAQTARKTKTHIHTNHPGKILEFASALGNLTNIKIENMLIQHRNLLVTEEELSNSKEKFFLKSENIDPVAYFAIVDNIELGKRFLEDGAAAVLIGGQTQNPSVADIEEGIKKIHAERIVILPNNKNIISTANLIARRSEKDIVVLNTTSMLEGHYVIKHKKEALDFLLQQLKRNHSIEITKASRNTKIGDLEIVEGDSIALVNGKIMDKAPQDSDLIKKVLNCYFNENTLHLFTSFGVDASEEGKEVLRTYSSSVSYEEFEGKQNNYPYYIYIEQRDPTLPKIAIVTDSASDLPEEWKSQYHIHVVPLRVKMGEKTFYDSVTITRKKFWKKLLQEKNTPKTSQPSPADFQKKFQELFEKGYETIITILLSTKLSGTLQSAKIAKSMMGEDKDIFIIDSKTGTFAEAHQVLEAAKLVQKGKKKEAVLARIEELQNQMKIYFVVNDLHYLQKGGRIGKISSMIGGILKIKPVLKLENGEISLEAKTIGERGALSYLEKIIKNEGKKNSIFLYTAWGGTNEELQKANSLKKIAEEYHKIEYKGRFEIGPTVGSHSGPAYGIGLMSKIR